MRLISTHFFFLHDTAPTEIYTLSLHDALPISGHRAAGRKLRRRGPSSAPAGARRARSGAGQSDPDIRRDGSWRRRQSLPPATGPSRWKETTAGVNATCYPEPLTGGPSAVRAP